MQIIDFHTHIYPEAIAAKAAQSIREFYNIGNSHMEGTVQQLLQFGKEAGITHFVELPVGLKPDHVGRINDFLVDQVQNHPEFTGFGTLHAAMTDLTEETQRLLELGLRGIKMHPDSQAFSIDDARLFPAYEILQAAGKPIIFHMGDHRFDFSHPARLRRLLEQFPKLKVIAAHFGGYSMMFMEDGVAEDFILRYGPERLVFGSDFPLWDPRDEVNRFLQLRLHPDQMEQIAYKTALNILEEV